jgi:hypothetical protein
VRLRPLILGVAIVLAGVAAALPGATKAASNFAPAATATVHPGVQLFTSGAQCTANFIYANGTDTFIGQAAHCSGTGGSTSTNGCTSPSLPIGTAVQITGAAHPGTMVYNSWLTMQSLHEADANTCAFNDLALVRIDPADVASTNPSVPFFGGPVGVGSQTLNLGDTVYTYGNSELRAGITQLSPKRGVSLGDTGGGWSHGCYTITPGIPGDSGSGFLDATGHAIGILSTVEIAPIPASNNFGDLSRELSYANAHGFSVSLVAGDVPFHAALLPPLPL